MQLILSLTLIKDFATSFGVGCIGIFGFICIIKSLTMIPPSTVATLRTSQIFVAFIAQVLKKPTYFGKTTGNFS